MKLLHPDHGETLTNWINRVIGHLELASRQLESGSESAQFSLDQATTILRQRVSQDLETSYAKANRGLLAWQVIKIREFVDARIQRRLLVSDLSSVLEMSEAHFSRLFKLASGESPHAYILRRRLELAARLMLDSAAPLSDIALQCGFADQAHLCKQFQQAVKVSPAAWRRAKKSGAGQPVTSRTHRPGASTVQRVEHGTSAA